MYTIIDYMKYHMIYIINSLYILCSDPITILLNYSPFIFLILSSLDFWYDLLLILICIYHSAPSVPVHASLTPKKNRVPHIPLITWYIWQICIWSSNIDLKSSLKLSGKKQLPTQDYLFMLIQELKMNATSNLVCIKPSSTSSHLILCVWK